MEVEYRIGELTLTEFHQTIYVKNKATENVSNLSEEEINMISPQLKRMMLAQFVFFIYLHYIICLHHHIVIIYVCLHIYEFIQQPKKCCDPYKKQETYYENAKNSHCAAKQGLCFKGI